MCSCSEVSQNNVSQMKSLFSVYLFLCSQTLNGIINPVASARNRAFIISPSLSPSESPVSVSFSYLFDLFFLSIPATPVLTVPVFPPASPLCSSLLPSSTPTHSSLCTQSDLSKLELCMSVSCLQSSGFPSGNLHERFLISSQSTMPWALSKL